MEVFNLKWYPLAYCHYFIWLLWVATYYRLVHCTNVTHLAHALGNIVGQVANYIFDIRMSMYRNIITYYNQQDATFLEFIYFYRRSTSFRRFLHPSSGAHNCTYSFRYCQPILLLAATRGGDGTPSPPR